jgi:hypothetical protein
MAVTPGSTSRDYLSVIRDFHVLHDSYQDIAANHLASQPREVAAAAAKKSP